jgi:hypothetical protein
LPDGFVFDVFVFCIPKIPIWVYLESLGMENVGIVFVILTILRPFGIIYFHLVYFVAIWLFFPVLLCCTKKNLATRAAHTPEVFPVLRFVRRAV